MLGDMESFDKWCSLCIWHIANKNPVVVDFVDKRSFEVTTAKIMKSL